MDLPINAEVHCPDKLCGHLSHIILNPVSDKVTYVVVKSNKPPHNEYLVPVEMIIETSPNCIKLECSSDRLENMQEFLEVEYVPIEVTRYISGAYLTLPYAVPEKELVMKKHEQIPAGELAIRRGAAVIAQDGHVGRVDEFLIDPSSEHITHLILREGHLWGQKDVVIPLSLIDRIEDDAVYLKGTKDFIGSLPSIPVKRKWECSDHPEWEIPSH
jgi:sporulation protein YlmC with PRC-barrel domain